MIKFWRSYDVKLIYIGDGHPREPVQIVRIHGSADICKEDTRQVFLWPNGQKHAVPPYTVVEDTPEVRKQLGLQ